MEGERFDRLVKEVARRADRRTLLRDIGSTAMGGLLALCGVHKSKAATGSSPRSWNGYSVAQNEAMALTVERATPALHNAMLDRLRGDQVYGLLEELLAQDKHVSDHGVQTLVVLYGEALLRTIAVAAFHHADDPNITSILTYGVEANQDSWVHAIVYESGQPGYLLQSDTPGGIERIPLQDGLANANAGTVRGMPGFLAAATAIEFDACRPLDSIVGAAGPNICDPCFQCNAVCSIAISVGLVSLGLSCNVVVDALCGPAVLVCAAPVWVTCNLLVGVLLVAPKSVICLNACHAIGSCETCQPVDCGSGQYFDSEVCACRCKSKTGADLRLCNGRCVDAGSDAKHCNGCGNVCPSGKCVKGSCRPASACNPECADGEFCCEGVCHAIGSCCGGRYFRGRCCTPTQACSDGSTCCPDATGIGPCGTSNDLNNCGACGHQCEERQGYEVHCCGGVCCYIASQGYPNGQSCCNSVCYDGPCG